MTAVHINIFDIILAVNSRYI